MLVVGVLLRILLWIVTPYDLAYDDHLDVVLRIEAGGTLPRPDECWQCYQPPLFYLVGAGVHRAATVFSGVVGVSPGTIPRVAGKAVQLLPLLAGCLTLFVCRSILRRLRPDRSGIEALGLAVIAVLPQHVYMSAMMTNDALTYLVASMAIHEALAFRSEGFPASRAARTGAWCGAAVLSKAYGLVTAGIVIVSCLVAAMRRGRGERRLRSAALVAGVALAVGVWPAARNVALYGRPHVDNFQLFRSGMHQEPPGSVRAIDFLSFRLAALLRFPWVHVSHLDSFWTEMYARFWFEYEGVTFSLERAPEWKAHRDAILAARGGWTRQAWNEILDWRDGDVPPGFRLAAVSAYLAGLPLTALILLGASVVVWRALVGHSPTRFGEALLSAAFFGNLLVPLVQTLRLPFFAAMKAAFALAGIGSVPFLIVTSIDWTPDRWRRAVSAFAWLAVLIVGLADLRFIAALHASVP